jgi:hypothetical protein
VKRIQNKIAENGLSLPVVAVYSFVVWLLAGLLKHLWWPQLACFVLSVYLIIEMSNVNALLRIRSRMVSVSFMVLMGMLSFLFGSLTGGLTLLFTIAATLVLLSTYQNPEAQGRVFYAFLFLGLASMAFVQILFLVPLLWLLMATQLQSLGWRSLIASVIGLLTPYWFAGIWFIYQYDFTPLTEHFAQLADFRFPADYTAMGIEHWLAYGVTVALVLIGIVSFWHNSYEDKIRIRLLYGFFSWMTTVCLAMVVLQPQHFDPLMRLAVMFASPLLAHFIALTNTRLSNILFIASAVILLLVTAFNLY